MWHFSKWFVSGPVPSPSLPRRAETDWAGQVVHDILLKTLSVSKRPRGHQTSPSCSHGPLLPACQLVPDQRRPSPTRPCGWVWVREAYISLPAARCVGAASGWGQASCEACREGEPDLVWLVSKQPQAQREENGQWGRLDCVYSGLCGFWNGEREIRRKKRERLGPWLCWVVKHPQAGIVVRAAGLWQAEEEERGGPAHMWLLHQSLFLFLSNSSSLALSLLRGPFLFFWTPLTLWFASLATHIGMLLDFDMIPGPGVKQRLELAHHCPLLAGARVRRSGVRNIPAHLGKWIYPALHGLPPLFSTYITQKNER